MTLLLKLVILGRPNVGKSTLFNRLVGRKQAIVHNTPGVTRDWQEIKGSLADLEFQICDTAGLEGFESQELKTQILDQTTRLIGRADLLLFVIDAREGLTKSEEILAHLARTSQKPVILIANKCEGRQGLSGLYESYRLGLGDPLALSAEHGEGFDDLYQSLSPHFATLNQENEQDVESESLDIEKPKGPLRLAIVGRPNVGKSTLINTLLRENRVLTGDQPGITRDSVCISWHYNHQDIDLIDTAGLRRRSRIEDSLEKFSASSSLLEIRYAEVVILVLDAHDPLNKQDLNIASHVVEEGRALVIAVNKWDTAPHDQWHSTIHKLEQSLSQVKGVTFIPISALKNHNLSKLMKNVFDTYQVWQKRISTSHLNQWLEMAIERHAPPLSSGRPIRLKYVTQIKSRPPTFAFFVSKPVEIPESYKRYLMTSLRETFDMPGVPIRLLLRKGKNPYHKK